VRHGPPRHGSDRIAPLIVAIVNRAREQGELRQDFESTDVPLTQVALTALMDHTRHVEPMTYRRYLTLIFDGMRRDRGPVSTLPVDALSIDQTHAAFTRRSETTRRW
jgi:hypothetical protein